MKEKMRRNAGLISSIAALLLVFAIYTSFGTIDLVFKKDNNEIYRMNDVNAFSSLEITDEAVPEDSTFTYVSGNTLKNFGDNIEFRFEIAKTVFLNFITFNWDESEQIIVLDMK